MKVKVENISYNYKSHKALSDITFSLDDADLLTVIGGNGAGKSTLLKCLLKELNVVDGSITYDDIELNKYSDWNKIGYLPQSLEFFNFSFPVSVIEFLKAFQKKIDIKKIEQLLRSLDLIELKNKNINKLSGGQIRRVFMARALLNNPKLLILDEPLTGIDKKSIDVITAILQDYLSENNTAIVVSHQLNHFKDITTKIIEIDHGKKVNYNEVLI